MTNGIAERNFKEVIPSMKNSVQELAYQIYHIGSSQLSCDQLMHEVILVHSLLKLINSYFKV